MLLWIKSFKSIGVFCRQVLDDLLTIFRSTPRMLQLLFMIKLTKNIVLSYLVIGIYMNNYIEYTIVFWILLKTLFNLKEISNPRLRELNQTKEWMCWQKNWNSKKENVKIIFYSGYQKAVAMIVVFFPC